MEKIFVSESFLEFCGHDLVMTQAQINLTIHYLKERLYSNETITEKDVYKAFWIPWTKNKVAKNVNEIECETFIDAKSGDYKFVLNLDFVA